MTKLCTLGRTFKKEGAKIRNDPEARALFRKETTRERGRPKKKSEEELINGNNVPIKRPDRGNSEAFILQQLSQERSDLFSRVVSGELSANAAAKQAGWRKKRSPLEALRAAWNKASEEERGVLTDIVDPVDYVVAQNDTRRHLDTSQRALIAARMANLKRGGLRNPSGNNQYETKEVKAQRCALTSDETPPMVSTKRAAALMKVGERTVDHAKRIIESNNQDVIKAVDTGQLPDGPERTRDLVPCAGELHRNCRLNRR
jgi:hypothetical protein